MATTHTNKFGQFLKKTPMPVAGFALGVASDMALGQKSLPSAIQRGIKDAIAWGVAPHLMGAKMAYDLIAPLTSAGYSAFRRAQSDYGFSFGHNMRGNYFQDTQATYTMRQRAVQAIQNSRMNARSALGREASLMHQGMATPPQMRSRRMGW